MALENNPDVMTQLARTLGLSQELAFYDVLSLSDPDLLATIPRPVLALLVIIPLTPTWEAERQAEDHAKPEYQGVGSAEPTIWFKQTIGNACGSIGLLHCAINGPASDFILPGSHLDRIRRTAVPLNMDARADFLYHDKDFEEAHKSCVDLGDTAASNQEHKGQHFVAFVKAHGHLWELEGSRKGPLDRGTLGTNDDCLSPKALEQGFSRAIQVASDAGEADHRFSCIALAPARAP